MAHFAELDEQNTVIRVVVISNDDILDENGVEQEQLGIDLCNRIVGQGDWIQTSYNNNFRRQFAQVGYVFAPDKDVFYDPIGPFASWVLDDNYEWQSPVPCPTDGKRYWWNEDSLSWVESVDVAMSLPTVPYPTDGNYYYWDNESETWVQVTN